MKPLHANGFRIVVVGTSCVGKSTFVRRLSAAWRLPAVDLDTLYWGPDWQPKPRAEFVALVEGAIEPPAWIVDGNYGALREVIWPPATHVIWLDYSLPLTLWRGIKRTIVRCATRQELWHGNRESFVRSFLSTDSILVWILGTHARRRRELRALRDSNQYPNLTWIEFRHPGAAELWLRAEEANS